MVLKQYKGYNSGNTIRKSKIKKTFKDQFLISRTEELNENYSHFDLYESNIPYSQNKRRQWEVKGRYLDLMSASTVDDRLIIKEQRIITSGKLRWNHREKLPSKRDTDNTNILVKVSKFTRRKQNHNFTTENREVANCTRFISIEGNNVHHFRSKSLDSRNDPICRRRNLAQQIHQDELEFYDSSEDSDTEQLLSECCTNDDDIREVSYPTRRIQLNMLEAVNKSSQKSQKRKQRKRNRTDTQQQPLTEKKRTIISCHEVSQQPAVIEDNSIDKNGVEVLILSNETTPDYISRHYPINSTESSSYPRCFTIDLTSELKSKVGPYPPRYGEHKNVACLVFKEKQYKNCNSLYKEFIVKLEARTCHSTPELQYLQSGQSYGLNQLVRHCLACVETLFTDNLLDTSTKFIHGVINQKTTSKSTFNYQQYIAESVTKIERNQNSTDQLSVVMRSTISSDDPLENNMCSICLDDVESMRMTILNCGHTFCTICLSQYIHQLLLSNNELICAGYNCRQNIDLPTILCHTSLNRYTNYERRITEKSICRCPSCLCTLIVGIDGAAQSVISEVRCVCSFTFCLLCQGEGHWPASCSAAEHYRNFLLQSQLTAKTVRLKKTPKYSQQPTVTGKHCPHCRRFMIKETGCNHMVCVCRKTFCWGCARTHDRCACYTGSKTRRNRLIAQSRSTYALIDVEKSNIKQEKKKKTTTSVGQKTEMFQDALQYRLMQPQSYENRKKEPQIVQEFTDILTKLNGMEKSWQQWKDFQQTAQDIVHSIYQLRHIIEYLLVGSVSISQCNTRREYLQCSCRLIIVNNLLSSLLENKSNNGHLFSTSADYATLLNKIEEQFKIADRIICRIVSLVETIEV